MSKEFLKKVKAEIYKEESISDKEVQIIRFQFFKKSNILKVIIKSNEAISNSEEEIIKKSILNNLKLSIEINILCYIRTKNTTIEEVATKYWLEVISDIALKHPLAKGVLMCKHREVKDNKIIISYPLEAIINHIKIKAIDEAIKSQIEDLFDIKASIEFKVDESLEDENYIEEKNNEEKAIIKEALANTTVHKEDVIDTKPKDKPNNKNKNYDGTPKYKRESKSENTILGRDISLPPVDIKEIDQTSGYVAVLGEIFKTEILETKTGRIILTFFITDYTSSIAVKCFLKPNDKDEILDQVKKGLYCKVRGEAVYDNYSREVVIMCRDIMKIKKNERLDTENEKRVELHLHTTMSTMDGMTSANKLISRANKWGHKAIAITDHGVAQAFPEAQIASKNNNNIKVLYGVEGYLVDNGLPVVINERGNTLKDTFVVFDLETTGFSPINDKIIEIGAVKIKDNVIIDTFSKFVDPEIRIPYKITELTSITDDMVGGAGKIDTVLKEFMEFARGTVLVAHNAPFDTSFIKKNCRDLNLEYDFSVLDTVPLARFLYPELKKVKLNIVAKHLGINLENHHRAVDDAKATSDILLKCFEKLEEELDIHDLHKLNEEFLINFDIKKQPSYHIIIIAKTQNGLKNLYKLISEAHLDNFFKAPRTKKSRLQEMREGLIIGSACEAGELYRAILEGKSDEELKEIVDFYDYLEIQPLGNNNFMIENGKVKNEDELKAINKRIYDLGKKYNKITCATGDVHFLEPQDAIFRSIIMTGKGFKDADNQPPLYFKTTDEMLKEFSYLGEDIAREVVITNTNLIADSCEVIKPIPDETYPPKIDGAEDDIKNMTLKKVHDIYGDPLPTVVQKRLDKELNSIINNGYAVLYLIAQKLVAKSLADGYLVGSRGSVGSSFVATMADITEVNGLPPHYVCPNCKHSEFFTDGSVSSGADLPDKNCPKCGALYIRDGHDIPFETFLGFDGDKEPDIDLNFSGDNQGEIHKYTEVLFGKGFTFKAGTIGTVAEKTAYGYVKKYLEEKNIRVSSAEIDRLTIGCTGIKRTSGQHPGGIMVVPSDNEIYNFCPIQHPADDPNSDIVTTHFDYHSISGRLLKLDILGHDDPTVLRMLQDLTGLDPKTIPLNDEKVISLFTSPNALGITKEELECEVGTYGLPEFGTKFVRGMLVDTQPESFADLVRISGLSHGTDVWLNNAQYFIGEGYTTLRDCIATRDDIMVYLMHQGVEPKLAFTIMESVRKGKGLKEEYELAMRQNNVPEWYIESCKKIKYMFPKGHAVAYVMMAVRIAYFKVYYPLAYYATYFTVRADDFDADLICKGESTVHAKLQELYELGNAATVKDKGLITALEMSFELFKRGFNFLRVDIYKSEAIKFTIEDGKLRPPLNALQGLGDNAAKSIVQARVNGEFISKEDLRIRAKIGKAIIETLDNHGCLEGMSETNQLSLF